ncbi:MAG: flavodoxin family protein [Deltaproteobacteria bacterium]|nr:flavodoxin family protein [Deltaproteobacteria bacterium]
MAKKIMIISGSPRDNGNTLTVADWVSTGATDAGATVEIVRADRIPSKERGCTACMGCQNSEKFGCVIKDDISTIIAKIPEQNVLVLASPVYFMGFSAQIKCIIDRMYSLFKITRDGKGITHPLQYTRFALIATAAGSYDHGLNLLEDNMKAISSFFGKEYSSLLVPHAPVKVGSIITDTELLENSLAFGRELAS